MNILLYNFGSYTLNDLRYYLEKAGHHCKSVTYKFQDLLHDHFFSKRFGSYLNSTKYDCVISTNFFPLVADLCKLYNIKYLSWSYDSPISKDYLTQYGYSTNYIFLFDKEEVQYCRNLGLDNVYHLPLATNTKRLSSIVPNKADISKYSCDISFIGQFYQSPLKDLLMFQNDYIKGYINALVDSQIKVYGYNFIADCISDDFLSSMNEAFNKHGLSITEANGNQLSKAGLVHSINKQITRLERISLLKLLSQKYNVHLYSTEEIELLKEVTYKGTAHYFSEMPLIFKLSKININPTLKSIHSGIPLRALDIMGSGGFLLSNYQPELAEYFRPDIDIIMYDSIEDALLKAEYYLSHETERKKITQNALNVITSSFNYPDRIKTLFTIAGIE